MTKQELIDSFPRFVEFNYIAFVACAALGILLAILIAYIAEKFVSSNSTVIFIWMILTMFFTLTSYIYFGYQHERDKDKFLASTDKWFTTGIKSYADLLPREKFLVISSSLQEDGSYVVSIKYSDETKLVKGAKRSDIKEGAKEYLEATFVGDLPTVKDMDIPSDEEDVLGHVRKYEGSHEFYNPVLKAGGTEVSK